MNVAAVALLPEGLQSEACFSPCYVGHVLAEQSGMYSDARDR